MVAFVIFIISLLLIALLFTIKSLEIYHGRKIFLERQFQNIDNRIAEFIVKIEFWWSHVNFKNTRLIFSWIIGSIRKLIITCKRRFDHKQSHFFIKKEPDLLKNKNSVSFFLKNVSDYKKSLREGKDISEIGN